MQLPGQSTLVMRLHILHLRLRHCMLRRLHRREPCVRAVAGPERLPVAPHTYLYSSASSRIAATTARPTVAKTLFHLLVLAVAVDVTPRSGARDGAGCLVQTAVDLRIVLLIVIRVARVST